MKKYIAFPLALVFIFSLAGCAQKMDSDKPAITHINNSAATADITHYTVGKATQEEQLTLTKVKQLAEKGEDLSWDDFKQYKHEDVGSGLYIFRYDIDEKYCLMIGGGKIQAPPMYMRLIYKGDDNKSMDSEAYIDIRTEDVDNFIKNN